MVNFSKGCMASTAVAAGIAMKAAARACLTDQSRNEADD